MFLKISRIKYRAWKNGKNQDMHRYIDILFTVLGVFVLSFILCGLVTARFAVKLAVSFLAAIAATCILAYLVRGGRKRRTDYRSFVTYCILSDEKDVVPYFVKAGIVSEATPDDGLYACRNGAVCLFLKFSCPSRDNIAALYKKCREKGIKKLTVWCARFERSTTAIACAMPEVEIKFSTLRPLYKKLKKLGALDGDAVKPAPHATLKTLLPVVFSTKNSYRFAGVAVLLYALSLLTPLKAYYIAVATIALGLAVISRIYGEKSDRSA